MSYLSTSGFTKEQEEALFVPPEQIASLPHETRVSLAIQHEQLELAKRDSFWTALQGIATVIIPIAASVGLVSFFTGKRGK